MDAKDDPTLHLDEITNDSQDSDSSGESGVGGTDSNNTRISRKREREVSLEPATPQATTVDTDPAEPKERRTPAKKNRVSAVLDAPQEAEEDPAVSTSPQHESKIRQISQGVEDITWQNMQREKNQHGHAGHTGDNGHTMDHGHTVDDAGEAELPVAAAPSAFAQGDNPPLVIDNAGEDEHGGEADPAEIPQDAQPDVDVEDLSGSNSSSSDAVSAASSRPTSVLSPHSRRGSESEPEQEKRLKRKLGDRTVSDRLIPEAHSRGGSDSDPEQEKVLKRKLGDRSVSERLVPDVVHKGNGALPESGTVKRQRDDPDEDVNPRETKRPTPPPDEDAKAAEASGSSIPNPRKRSMDKPSTSASTPTPKMGGFMAYASTASPFPKSLGSSIFGSPKPNSPWASASASTSTGTSGPSTPGVTPSPFTSLSTSPAKDESQTPLKRTGFEAFASAASPFASVKRSKSPPLGGSFGVLARSRSPSRTPARATNAFSAYAAGGAQSFAVQTPRRSNVALTESADSSVGLGIVNGAQAKDVQHSEEGSKEGPEPSSQGVSFGDRLRAEKDEEEASDEERRVALTEQEVLTGEEEEEVRYQARGKLYVLTSENQWKEKGTGILKLNVRREDGSGARLVMRKDAVHSVLLNAVLFKGMRCFLAQDPRYLRFSVIEGSHATHYNLRLATSKIAEDLLEEMTSYIPTD